MVIFEWGIVAPLCPIATSIVLINAHKARQKSMINDERPDQFLTFVVVSTTLTRLHMEMIDSKSLFYAAHQLLKNIQHEGNREQWVIRKEEIQDLTIADKKYTLLVTVKPLEESLTPNALNNQELRQEELLTVAQELISAEPRPTGFELFKKDVQLFEDRGGNKYILGVAFTEFNNSLEMR